MRHDRYRALTRFITVHGATGWPTEPEKEELANGGYHKPRKVPGSSMVESATLACAGDPIDGVRAIFQQFQ
jgi:hypothetical protein